MSQLPRQPILSLDAPGITPAGPYAPNGGASPFWQAAAAFGIPVAEMAQQARREIADRKAEAEKVAQEYRGEAALYASTLWPDIQAKIDAGEIAVPDGVKISDFAIDYVEARLPEDVPEAYKEQFRRTIQPRLAASLKQQEDQRRQELAGESLRRGIAAAIANPEGLSRVIEESKEWAPQLADGERLGVLGLPALRFHARAGNMEAFDQVAAQLGDGFPLEMQAARAELASAVDREDAAKAADARDRLDTLAAADVPPKMLRERILAERDDIGERATAELLAKVRRKEEAEIREAQAVYAEDIRRRHLLGGDPAEIRDDIVRGLQRPPSDPSYIAPSVAQGLLATLGRKEQQDESRARVLARLSGANNAVTSADDAAILELLQSPNFRDDAGQLQPLIDQAGTVTDPERLGLVLGRLGRVPSEITDRIETLAQSDQPDDVARAARLFWTLRRVAPAAMDQAGRLGDLASTRLRTIAGRLDANSPPTRLPDGSPNPAFTAAVAAEAERVMPITRQVFEGVDNTVAVQQMVGATRSSEQPEKLRAMIREALPAHIRSVPQSLWGVDWLWPDSEVAVDQLPANFLGQFEDRARRYFVGLTAAGWSTEHARTEAGKRAMEELESDFLIVPHAGSLYALPRYDNPADLRWTAAAATEWAGEFESLKGQLEIPADTDVDEWRPMTRPGATGLLWAHVDDPLNILTARNGNPIRFIPNTVGDLVMKQAGTDQAKRIAAAEQVEAMADEQRYRLVEFVLRQREKRAAGQPYDRRLDDVDSKITDANVAWYRKRRLERAGGFWTSNDPVAKPDIRTIRKQTRDEFNATVDQLLGASTGP